MDNHDYPKIQVDECDNSVIWDFCGGFPLSEIAKGRRACRDGWRNMSNLAAKFTGKDIKPGEFSMVAVTIDTDSNLLLEREYEDEFGDCESFGSVDDMLAEDWYLERK